MHHRIATSRRDAFGRRDFCFSARILVRFVAGSLRDFCRREFCFPARILAKFAAGSRATCCAPATRLGLDTSRWKTLPEELTHQQLMHLSCCYIVFAIVVLTVAPRDVHAKKNGMDCLAACGTCRGNSCTNSTSPDLGENSE